MPETPRQDPPDWAEHTRDFLHRYWTPIATVLGMVPLFSISDHVVKFVGFIRSGIDFYRGLTEPIRAFVADLIQVDIPIAVIDSLVLYILVASTFIRCIGSDRLPRLTRYARSLRIKTSLGTFDAGLLLTLVAPFMILQIPLIMSRAHLGFSAPDYSAWSSITLMIAAFMLSFPAYLARKVSDVRRSVGRFYMSLAGSVLLFGVLAGVSEGLARAL